MKLADRIAAWFGYVPREWFVAYVAMKDTEWTPLHSLSSSAVKWDDEPETKTIIVSADFKRGIPCS